MTNEENEGSTGEQASGLEPDSQQVPTAPTPPAWPLPPSGSVPAGSAPAGPPTAPTPPAPPFAPAVGAPLSTHPHLAPSAGGYQGPPPPPYGYGWAQPPAAPTPSSRHATTKWLAAVGAAAALVVASVAIGHAVWSSPTHIDASGTSNNAGTPNSGGSTFNPFNGGSGGSGGSGESPFGEGTGNSGSGSGNSSVGSGPKDASSIASKVDPGLVDIDTTLAYQDEEAAGTGIVLTSNGEILTNNHVIEGATSISVTDVGNGKTYTASVVGYDRDKDIAVIQLNNASGLTTANLGNSSNVSVGQAVVGVGNAGGTGGTPTYAGGTVTALNQSITASDEGDGTSEQLTGLIETNADIQPGDSGGPLVNTSGEVLGMDTAASDTYTFEGGGGSGDQGYTIPINTALAIAHEIKAGDSSVTVHVGPTPFLGVTVEADSSSSGGGGFFGGGGGGSEQTVPGALIHQVVTSGPAQEAGLAEGDLITAVDGTNISSPTALTNALLQYKAGDSVTVTYTDTSGSSHTTTVKLSSGPPQ